MAVLTNRGILISALEEYESPTSNDLLVIQDITKNKTKKITLTNLATGLFASADGSVNFKNVKNKFTGSFYVPSDTGGGTPATLTSYGRTKLGLGPTGIPALDVYYNASLGPQAYIKTNIFNINTNSSDITVTYELGISAADVLIAGRTQFADSLTASYGRIDSLIANVTGNVFGNLYGDVYSSTANKVLENSANLAKDAQFYGTSSYATKTKSSSYAKVADLTYTCVSHTTDADTATSASYALQASHANTSSYLDYTGANNGTASFAQRAALALIANNVINVPSTSSYSLKSKDVETLDAANSSLGTVAYFDGTKYVGTKDFTRISNGTGLSNYQFLTLSSSRYLNALVISSRGYSTYGNQAAISFYNLNNSKSYPNISGYTIGSYYSGSLMFIAPLGSAEFSSSTRVAVGSATETYTLVGRRSGYYFWPYMSDNTPSREGSIGIGVQPPGLADTNPYLLGKLHLRCFSSSKAHVGKVTGQTLTGTVKLPEYAIYVDYGSSSYNPLFSVGASGSNAGDVYASGDVQIAGDLTVDGNLNATLGYGESTANAFGVRYTTGCITYGKYVYFTQLLGSSASGNQDSPSNFNRLLRLNQQTNEITIIIDFKTAYSQTAHAGHLSLLKFVNQGGYNEDNILFVDHNGYVNVVGDLLNATMPSRIYRHSIGNGGYGQWRVAYVDTNSPASNTNPDFYLLPDSFNTNILNNGIRLIKASTTGPNVSQVGTNLNLNSTINATWATPQLLNGGTSYYYRVLTMIYNPNSNKRRLYVVGNATGLCDVYNLLGYSSDNIATWWAQSDATRYPQLQYEKTIVIPQPGSNYWTDANWESYGLEYDTTTGAEKFWSWNRVGNGLLTGIVGKAPFYGS